MDSTDTRKEIRAEFFEIEVKKERHPLIGTSRHVWPYGLSSYKLERWRECCRSENADMRYLNAAVLLQMSLHDDEGNLVFEEKEIAIIASKPAEVIEPLVRVVLRLSGYGAAAGEAILKNLHKILGAAGLSDFLESSNAQSDSSTDDTALTSSRNNTLPSSSGPSEPPQKQ